MAVQDIKLAPQEGPQEDALASAADILIYGGQAGGGKTFGLLLEPLRHLDNGRFGCVIFRRTFQMIVAEGGIWDTSMELYPMVGGQPNASTYSWSFPSGMMVRFAHMQHEKNRLDWKSAQIPLIQFDQLEEFTARQFWYMLSRNRSTSGVKPYIRAGCNPVPPEDPVGGWLHDLIGWWIDQETGYPIAARSGVLRWFYRDPATDHLVWADSPEELEEENPGVDPDSFLSLTFIPAALEDNPALLEKDPGYRAKLMALSRVERERLLGGNWLVAESAGDVFDRAWFPDRAAPAVHRQVVRYWDKAGTPEEEATEKHARSAGVAMTIDGDGRVAILDAVAGYWSAGKREEVIRQVAAADRMRWGNVITYIEQEPGSGGKESAQNTVTKTLMGFDARLDRATGDKVVRMRPLAAQAEVGNVYLVTGSWNEEARREFHRVAPGVVGVDIPDASAGAFNKLVLTPERKPLPPSGGQRSLA